MLKAVKANKVYTINETAKKNYLSQGYDIYDEKGRLVEKSPVSTVSHEAYSRLEAENKKLKSELAELKKQVKPDVSES